MDGSHCAGSLSPFGGIDFRVSRLTDGGFDRRGVTRIRVSQAESFIRCFWNNPCRPRLRFASII